MTHRFSAWLHAWLVSSTTTVGRRLRTAPQAGQGTVEYVALILLVAAVLAAAVAVAGKGSFDLEQTVTKQLTNAINSVSGAKK